MRRIINVLAAGAVAGTVGMPVASMAQAPNRTKVGTLTCDISGGIGVIIASKKSVACMFTPAQPGPREVYTGSISKFGLDVGATAGGEMVWSVFAPSNKVFGALAEHHDPGETGAQIVMDIFGDAPALSFDGMALLQ